MEETPLLLLIDLAVLLPLEISIMGARAPPPSARRRPTHSKHSITLLFVVCALL